MEILLSVCLYFIRSVYHESVEVSEDDLQGNFCVQIASIELLTKTIDLLLEVAVDSGVAFGSFVWDLIGRCKVQRIVLHCLLSTVYTLSDIDKNEIYNVEASWDSSRSDFLGRNNSSSQSRFDLQKKLLKLVQSLIFIEERIGSYNSGAAIGSTKKSKAKSQKLKASQSQLPSPFEYVNGQATASQPMFLSSVLSALKEEDWHSLHHDWISLIIASLSKFGEALPKIVVPAVDQICLNLKTVSRIYQNSFSVESLER